MRSDFEMALTLAPRMSTVVRHYDSFPIGLSRAVEYDHICTRPVWVACAIAEFLEVAVDDAVLRLIVVRYTKEQVRRRIEAVEQDLSGRARLDLPVHDDERVVIYEDNVRVFDLGTGSQLGHIGGTRDSERVAILTPQRSAPLALEIKVRTR